MPGKPGDKSVENAEKQNAGLVLSLQKREKMLVQRNKRDPAPDAFNIFTPCLIGSHYYQFLTLL